MMREMGFELGETEADPEAPAQTQVDIPGHIPAHIPRLPEPALGPDGLPAGMGIAPAGVNTGAGAR